ALGAGVGRGEGGGQEEGCGAGPVGRCAHSLLSLIPVSAVRLRGAFAPPAHSLTAAVSVLTFEDGRAANGAMRTSKPLRPPMCRSSGPLTQFTTEPSYLPGPKKPLW